MNFMNSLANILRFTSNIKDMYQCNDYFNFCYTLRLISRLGFLAVYTGA